MQHLWLHHRKPTCSFATYKSLINSIQFTERNWNSGVSLNNVLQHITLAINADINYIQFKRRENKPYNNCTHKTRCYLFKYKFQSSLVKMLFQSIDFYPISLLEFQNKVYLVANSVNLQSAQKKMAGLWQCTAPKPFEIGTPNFLGILLWSLIRS